jgi:hypothetical protein
MKKPGIYLGVMLLWIHVELGVWFQKACHVPTSTQDDPIGSFCVCAWWLVGWAGRTISFFQFYFDVQMKR